MNKMKEVSFNEKDKLIKYLREPRELGMVDSIRVKLQDHREVKNWVRVDGLEVTDRELKVTQLCGRKTYQYEVVYIYPIEQLETVRVLRHHKDDVPKIDFKVSKFGLDNTLVTRDLLMQSLAQ